MAIDEVAFSAASRRAAAKEKSLARGQAATIARMQAAAPAGVITPAELFNQTPAGQARTLGRLGVAPDLSQAIPGRTGYMSGVSPLASMTAEDLAGLPQSARASAYQRLVAPPLSPTPMGPGIPSSPTPLGPALPASPTPLGPALPSATSALGPALPGALPGATTATAATPVTAAKEVAKQGMMGGMMARTPLAGLAAQMGMGSAATAGSTAAKIGTGTLGRALPWVAGGQIAGEISGRLWDDPNSSSDNALKNALQLGGAGAAIGSMILPGIGTAIGGLGGAGIGWAAGKFGPKSTGSVAVNNELGLQTKQLTGLMDQLGLQDPAARSEILGTLRASTMGMNSKDEVKGLAAQLAQQIPAYATQTMTQATTEREQQARMLAVQQMFAPMMQDALYGMRQSGLDTRRRYDELADSYAQVDPQTAALYRARGALMAQSADATSAAYAAQVALGPQKDDSAQIAKQLEQRVQNSQLSALSRQILEQINGGGGGVGAGIPGA